MILPRLLICLFVIMSGPAQAQFGADDRMVEAQLVADHSSVAQGQTFRLALHQDIEPGWHTYWRNPGDSGDRTRITLSLPDDWQISEFYWPEPGLYSLGPLRNYGYSDEVTLPLDVTVPETMPDGPFLIRAEASWLVCADICIPEEASFELLINIGETELNPESARLISPAFGQLPQLDPSIQSGLSLQNETLFLTVTSSRLFQSASDVRDVQFLPYEPGVIQHSAEQRFELNEDGLALSLLPGRRTQDGFDEDHTGLLVFDLNREGRWRHHAYEINPVSGEMLFQTDLAGVSTGTAGSGDSGRPSITPATLWQALLLAFAGGLILNLMPCVFPILSMKALHLAQARNQHPLEARQHGLLYSSGVILTFMALGAIILMLRDLGLPGGWGFQLQLPLVVAGLSLLMAAIGLNLLGWFNIGSSLQGVGGEVRDDSRRGSFLTGTLAVFVAAPCLAPFMAVALTYALSQPATLSIAIFASLGLGLAFPFILISVMPGLISFLPKPGPWMVRFRQVLSLPMFLAAIWLGWILSVQVGMMGLIALGAGLAALIIATRFYGKPGWGERGVSMISGLVIVAAVLVTSRLDMAPVREPGGNYERWSEERIVELQADERVIFVDFTAAWCVTCQVNKLGVLASNEAQSVFADNNVALLRADFTNQDPAIAEVLGETGLVGVPRYLVYPANGGEPAVLPSLLSIDIIEQAIQEAQAGNRQTALIDHGLAGMPR